MSSIPSVVAWVMGLTWSRWARLIGSNIGSRIASGLFLMLVLALLTWGCFLQPPRNYPFERPDPLTWLRGRDVHHGYTKMPMVPVGLFHKFAPRKLATESEPCCGLKFDDTFHDVRFSDASGVPHLLASLYQDPTTRFVYAITAAGELYTLIVGDRWQQISFDWSKSHVALTAGNVGELTVDYTPYLPVTRIALSPDGSRLVMGTDDGRIKHYLLGSDREDWTADLRRVPVTDVAWSHDGSRIAIGFSDGIAQVLSAERDWRHVSGIWDALNAPAILTIKGNGGSVNSIAFSLDDGLLVTGSQDKTVRLWNSTSGANQGTFSYSAPIRQVAFSADGSRIGVLAEDSSFHEIDPEALREVTTPVSTSGLSIQQIIYSPRDRMLAGVDGKGTTYLWNLDSGKRLSQSDSSHEGAWHLAFSPDGEILAAGSVGDDLTVLPANGLSATSTHLKGRYGKRITNLAFKPDGTTLIAGASDGAVYSWNVTQTNRFQIRTISAAADGTLWAAGRGGYIAISSDHKSFPKLTARWSENDIVSISPLESGGMVLLNSRHELALAKLSADGNLSISEIQDTLPKDAGTQQFNTIFVDKKQAWLASEQGQILYAPDIGKPIWALAYKEPSIAIDDLLVERSGVSWAVGRHDGRETVIAASPTENKPWTELSVLLPRWVFFIGAPLLLMALNAVYLTWRSVPEVLHSIDDLATCDLALRWSDPASLPLKPAVRKLSRFLRNVSTKPPLTIAVTGPWGSGKSSLMQLLMEDLQYNAGRAVWFNAWHHHEEDDLLAALFAAIRRDAPPPWWTGSGLYFRLRLWVIRFARSLQALAFAVMFVGIFIWGFNMAPLSSALTDTLGTVLDLKNDTLRAVVKVFSGTVGAGLLGLGLLWLKGQLSSLPANPAKLVAGISQRASLADFSDKLAFRSKFGEQFGEVCRALWSRSTPGLVIFIDDLDRCQPDEVLKILEAVNYLVSAGLCTVILGIDRRQVEFCVGYGFRDIVGGVPDQELSPGASGTDVSYQKQRVFARRYLEKLINIEVEIPPLDDLSLVMLFPGDTVQDTAIFGDGPSWLRRVKHGIRELLQISRAALLILIVATVLAWGLNRTPSWLLASFASLNLKPSVTDLKPPLPATTAPISNEQPKDATNNQAQGERSAVSVPEPVSHPVEAQTTNESLPGAGWWTLWSPALAMCGLVGIVVVLYFLHVKPLVKDSDEFSFSLGAVMPLFKAVSATPRAIKRYQNRMRYISAWLRRGFHEPDGLDVFVHWLGSRRAVKENKFLHNEWFEPDSKLAIRESSLILLAAIEIFAPNAFADRPSADGAI